MNKKKSGLMYTLGEEIFNSVSHGAGTLLSIAGTVVLIVFAAIYSNAYGVVSSCIYGASLIILYTMSTLYHSLTNKKAKRVFRIMDHTTIFLLIAGTYTPFTFVALNGALGWTIFGLIWGAAIIGIVLNSINLDRYAKISVVCYVIMGLGIVGAIKPLAAAISPMSLWFLVAGGAFYIFGIIFYAISKIKYFHSVWHLFTIGGSVCHYFSILLMIMGK